MSFQVPSNASSIAPVGPIRRATSARPARPQREEPVGSGAAVDRYIPTAKGKIQIYPSFWAPDQTIIEMPGDGKYKLFPAFLAGIDVSGPKGLSNVALGPLGGVHVTGPELDPLIVSEALRMLDGR